MGATRFYITDREEIPNIPPLTYNVKSFIIFLGAKGIYSIVPQHELTGENIIFSHCAASWHPQWKEARCRIVTFKHVLKREVRKRLDWFFSVYYEYMAILLNSGGLGGT